MTVNGNHLVGGEFELKYLGDDSYELRLIQYRDALQTENTVIESTVLVRVFQKTGDIMMGDFILNFVSSSSVSYNNPGCTGDFIKTDKVVYAAVVALDPQKFNHEGGYYVAWERCCRNNSIDNISLSIPNTVGMTYYLEFPPVRKNGKLFKNSTPTNFTPLQDYACVGVPYSADFSGEDDDGDSLVYTLATPLDSSTDDALPSITTAPYPLVPWATGFNQENMITGSPPLTIDKKGLLSVTPGQVGLYVFSVKVEEFRGNVKIGEVRRDFQLLVVDCPRQSKAPSLTFNLKGEDNFDPLTEIAVLENTLSDEQRCVEIVVTDEESLNISSLKAVAVNTEADPGELYTVSPGVLNASEDSMRFQVCFNACPAKASPYVIDFIASDNACPMPLYDTLRVSVLVEPPFNSDPYFSQEEAADKLAYAGNLFELPIRVSDDDGDLLSLKMVGVDFDTTGYNIKFSEVISEAGRVDALFSWSLNCEYFDLEQTNTFSFLFISDDQNKCGLGDPDTLRLDLNIEDLFADFDSFDMPNVFTPNGDGKNDFYGMCKDAGCDFSYTLPPDNCLGRFINIEIYNRWGKKVYGHDSRDFRWDGGGNGAGVYFYFLKYTHREFKGQVTLIR